MASLRRTKNFANDPQTPMFLYAILKQLDLRSINWNVVADGLGISNGHAARMRYSRMKSQFEGLPSQAKPPKSKKENTGETKSSKSKAKNNKRLLMEDENERIASNQSALPSAMQQESNPKRVKVEPQPYMNHWNVSNMYTGYTAQPYVNAYWGQPMIKTEPSAFGVQHNPPQSFPSSPAIKKEPELDDPSSLDPLPPATIKQEPESLTDNSDVADSDLIIVKQEPGTTIAQQVSPVIAHSIGAAPTYPLAHTINTYFDRQQSPLNVTQPQPSLHSIPMYSTPQTYLSGPYPSGPYPSVNSCNPAQSAFSLPAPTHGTNMAMSTTEEGSNNMMLNPYAATYQDMLNMPLHQVRSPSIMQIPNPNMQQTASQLVSNEVQQVVREQETGSKELPARAPRQEHDSLPTTICSASVVAATASPVPAPVELEPTPAETTLERGSAIDNVIELESDAEVGSDEAPAIVPDDRMETKIKTEIVEL